jgi:hypothetical protein
LYEERNLVYLLTKERGNERLSENEVPKKYICTKKREQWAKESTFVL